MRHQEFRLRDYLARNLHVLDPRLNFVAVEHAFPGGRIDILARRGRKRVGIEVKARPYDTQKVCAQLMHYCETFPLVYFVAPKVRYGVYGTLRQYCHSRRLSLFEIGDRLTCSRVTREVLDDTRPFPTLDVFEWRNLVPFFSKTTTRTALYDLLVAGVLPKTMHEWYRNIVK